MMAAWGLLYVCDVVAWRVKAIGENITPTTYPDTEDVDGEGGIWA